MKSSYLEPKLSHSKALGYGLQTDIKYVDVSNEVLKIDFCQGTAKIPEVKVRVQK